MPAAQNLVPPCVHCVLAVASAVHQYPASQSGADGRFSSAGQYVLSVRAEALRPLDFAPLAVHREAVSQCAPSYPVAQVHVQLPVVPPTLPPLTHLYIPYAPLNAASP